MRRGRVWPLLFPRLQPRHPPAGAQRRDAVRVQGARVWGGVQVAELPRAPRSVTPPRRYRVGQGADAPAPAPPLPPLPPLPLLRGARPHHRHRPRTGHLLRRPRCWRLGRNHHHRYHHRRHRRRHGHPWVCRPTTHRRRPRRWGPPPPFGKPPPAHHPRRPPRAGPPSGEPPRRHWSARWPRRPRRQRQRRRPPPRPGRPRPRAAAAGAPPRWPSRCRRGS